MSDRARPEIVPRYLPIPRARLSRPLEMALVMLVFTALALPAQTITPTPTLTNGTPCPAVVTLSWDLAGVAGANRVLWELDDDPFSNPSGPEQDRLAAGSATFLRGSTTIDLRLHGQVLNGARYYFRVVAKNNQADVALRSQPVVFSVDRTPDGTVRAVVQENPPRIRLDWTTLRPEIRACSDAIFWEAKAGSNFTSQGADPARFDAGGVPISAGFVDIPLPTTADPGEVYVRLVGKHGGLTPDADVGRRSSGMVARPAGLRPPRPGGPKPTSTAPKILDFTIGNGSRGVAAGQVPFRYTATGVVAAYRVGPCAALERGTRFETLRALERDRLSVFLPPGSHDVCLQVRNRAGDVSPRAATRVTVTGPRLNGLAFHSRAGAVSSADVGERLTPVLDVRGAATHFRFASCVDLPTARWQVLPSRTPGRMRLPEITRTAAGLYEFCAQVRQVVAGQPEIVSNSRNTQVRYYDRVVHEVPAAQALEVARRLGWRHSAIAIQKDSQCRIEGANFHSKGHCRFVLFPGRALAEGWEVVELEVSHSSAYYFLEIEQRPSGNRPELRFAAQSALPPLFGAPTKPPCLGSCLGLPNFRLRGPRGAHWREAFSR